MKQEKVYELRTYSIKPQHVKDFLTLTSEEFHLRTSQSKLIGYWTSELGGLNEVVHLWEYGKSLHLHTSFIALMQRRIALNIFRKVYVKSFQQFADNLEHRAQVRLSLAGNTEWFQRYFGKILPWMIGQQNSVVALISGIEIKDAMESGIYQLQIGNTNSYAVDALKTSRLTEGYPNSLLIGAFQTVHGQLNQIALLWQHKTLTAASEMVQQQLQGNKNNKNSNFRDVNC